MKSNVSNELRELFQLNSKVDISKITSITGSVGKNIYIDILNFLNETLDNFDYKSDISFLITALSYLEKTVTNYSGLNVRNFIPKLTKLYEKSARIIEEHGFELTDEKIDIINSICNKITVIADNLTNTNSERYNFFFYLITNVEHKNLNIIGRVIDDFNVGVKDKNGDSLLVNVLDYYLKKLDSAKANDNELYYYNNVLKLVVTKNKNGISEKEKAKCLNLIYLFLDRLSSKDKNYMFKREQCNSLIAFFKREFVDKNIVSNLAFQYNIPIEFDEMLEKSIYSKVKSIESAFSSRRIVDDYVLSIDGFDAKEIDDALSCRRLASGNFLLGVHIVDILAYLPYSSYIIKESIKRGSTIYLSDNYIPMLPEPLIDMATFVQGEFRFANSYYFEISDKGEIVNRKIEKTIIKNSAQMSYNKANSILADNTSDNYALREALFNLGCVSEIIDQIYKGGSLYLVLKEQRLNVSGNIVGSSISEKIVSNAMILVNNMVADLFYNNNYPFIYRVHSLNEEKQKEIMDLACKVKQEFTSRDIEKIFDIISKHYPKALYGISGSHEGLRLDHYTHVTSPLRRGADIVALECLNRCYFGNPTVADLDNLRLELLDIIPLLNETSDRIDMFAYDYENCRKKMRGHKMLKKRISE